MSALEPFKVMVKQEFMFSMPKTAASFCRAGHTVPLAFSINLKNLQLNFKGSMLMLKIWIPSFVNI